MLERLFFLIFYLSIVLPKKALVLNLIEFQSMYLKFQEHIRCHTFTWLKTC